MRYLSVCSGIEAASVAWEPLGWRPAGFAEIDSFPSAVLAHHWPEVKNYGDFTKIDPAAIGSVDVLVGGTPCQPFSIAGLRQGLDDDRGNLALEFCRLAGRLRARWVVWENVPGVLSLDEGRAFASILGGLVECGYGLFYRVLDAQFVRVQPYARAVPQRRRRVFVVGYLGDWRRAAAVLFERESMSGHPPPCRETGQGVAPTISARPTGGGGLGTDFDLDGGLVAHSLRGEGFDASEDGTGRGVPLIPEAANPLTARMHKGINTTMDEGQTMVPQAIAIQERAVSENPDAGPNGAGYRDDGAAYTLEARQTPQAVAFDMRGREGGAMPEGPHDTANLRSATGGSSRSYVATQWAVRRLTPRECERLQGFPDDFTRIPYRGKPAAQCPDGPRYKALGNSMAVPVMRWLGRRIAAADDIV